FSDQIREVSHLLVLHGASEVVRAHKEMQDLSLSEARAQFGDSLLHIRKDLGLDSRDLPAQDLAHLLSTGTGEQASVAGQAPSGIGSPEARRRSTGKPATILTK